MAPPVARILTEGDITVHGRIAGSSNATLLVSCVLNDEELLAVYKPEKGERSLWDFPRGLHRREVATYELAEALGLSCVPDTVERAEGPFGRGSVQRFVDEDGTSHYFTLRDDPNWWPALKGICALDVIINNADRKSGHVLLAGGRLWAIDHGLTFHAEPKLRTVIWDFAGEPLPDFVARGLCLLVEARSPDDPGGRILARLEELLEPEEVQNLRRRAEALLRAGTLPHPREDGDWPPYPWPLV